VKVEPSKVLSPRVERRSLTVAALLIAPSFLLD